MSALTKPPVEKNMVLAKAFLNAAEQLNLTQADLAGILGVHRTAISRLKSSLDLNPDSKQGEIALLVIRVYRALFALTGGDPEWMHSFMVSQNKVTGGVPKTQMKTLTGLVTVLQFVDAIRGKV